MGLEFALCAVLACTCTRGATSLVLFTCSATIIACCARRAACRLDELATGTVLAVQLPLVLVEATSRTFFAAVRTLRCLLRASIALDALAL